MGNIVRPSSNSIDYDEVRNCIHTSFIGVSVTPTDEEINYYIMGNSRVTNGIAWLETVLALAITVHVIVQVIRKHHFDYTQWIVFGLLAACCVAQSANMFS